LLKQFLADEELRKTVLVPLGVTMIAFPLLLFVTESVAIAVGAIAAAVGAFLIYKGMGIDEYLSRLPGEIQEALYSGQVSLVTYVVAGGLSLVGIFVGALGVRATGDESTFIVAMRFAFDGVPWFTAAALAAATGRLLDELIQTDNIKSAYVNLPFGAIAVGLVVRGFSVYFLERAGVVEQFRMRSLDVGPVMIEAVALERGSRLAVFILAGILVSLVGVRFAAYFSQSNVQEEFVD